ncbi:MAG TPA: hypothetical protein VKU02_07800 [Gemmataceae bacterium]|nr:hypothetical protein [Gemmataceae bacterium]
MYHELPRSATLCLFLFSVDQDFARMAREKACPCGGRLHCANYPRKPRGAEDLPEDYRYRFSFCCERDGCRKRVTPPSVRFLGRKVYLFAVVLVVGAMRQGPSPRRVRTLSQLFGADRRIIDRWQVFWREQFLQTSFWKSARRRLPLTSDIVLVPWALLQAFLGGDDPCQHWGQLLRFLSRITTRGGLASAVT